jgi:hypothetical protein
MVHVINLIENISGEISSLGQTLNEIENISEKVSSLERQLEIISKLITLETRRTSDSDMRGNLSWDIPNAPDGNSTYNGYGSTLRRIRPKPELESDSKSNIKSDVAGSALPDTHLPAADHLEDAHSRSSSRLSAESNSSTEDSEEDSINYPAVTRRTKILIKNLLRKVEWTFSYSCFMQCAGTGQSTSNEQGNIALFHDSGALLSTSKNKKRSRSERDKDSDDEQDDQQNKRNKLKSTVEPNCPAGPRFACPLFKHDPQRYISYRTCAGPGWPTVHRMKYAKF